MMKETLWADRRAPGEFEVKSERILNFDLSSELKHGVAVCNLAARVGRALGLDESQCHDLAVAGLVHDIGKLKLKRYVYVREHNPMVIEELKYVRMHSALGYEELKEQGGYSEFVLQSVLYHHENYDGSGYPSNLCGEEIPIGARILRVCDVFCALTSNRPYREAFDRDAAIEMMIDEVKDFDMRVFMAFLRVVHSEDQETGDD